MGNTPSSHQNSPTQRHPQQLQPHHNSPHRHHSLRLSIPYRHISPQRSDPTSPPGGLGSPRRRKSLELPDLNKLSFTPSALTPAAPVPTTHTHTSHHLAPSITASTHSTRSPSPPITPTASISAVHGARRWRDALSGGRGSPLAGVNTLGAMSKLEPVYGASSTSGRGSEVNPYFPDSYNTQSPTTPSKAMPIPIPGKETLERDERHRESEMGYQQQQSLGTEDKRGQEEQSKNSGLVNVPVQWTGGGKNVSVAGTWDGGWSNRIKLHRSTHDFNTILHLPPGQYRLKFIVDDSWRCSKQISTATDDDGTLVNWIEVEAPKTAEEIKAEWAMDSKPAVKDEDADESQWTSEIPPSLILYQYIEELPARLSQDELSSFLKSIPYIPNVPPPPTLPRILDKVIVNNDSKRLWDSQGSNRQQSGYQHATPAGLDDSSILAVPNHVVLNHLTASAIRNGTLGVGTTTRYRQKYITTMFFRDQPNSSEQQSHSIPQPVT
ncbi:hypothetical protein L204_103358 [Cryptococcus depauperatus]